jgi:hypothetical protein
VPPLNKRAATRSEPAPGLRVVRRASSAVDVYRLELAGRCCFIPGCELPALVLVAGVRSRPARGYCLEHGERPAALLADRHVVVWLACAVNGCDEPAEVLGLLQRSEHRTDVALLCRTHGDYRQKERPQPLG